MQWNYSGFLPFKGSNEYSLRYDSAGLIWLLSNTSATTFLNFPLLNIHTSTCWTANTWKFASELHNYHHDMKHLKLSEHISKFIISSTPEHFSMDSLWFWTKCRGRHTQRTCGTTYWIRMRFRCSYIWNKILHRIIWSEMFIAFIHFLGVKKARWKARWIKFSKSDIFRERCSGVCYGDHLYSSWVLIK